MANFSGFMKKMKKGDFKVKNNDKMKAREAAKKEKERAAKKAKGE